MIRKCAVALVVVGVVVVGLGGVAGAHVDFEAEGVLPADGLQVATLQVPNECEGSQTTSIDLNFPPTPTITSAVVAPLAGWTAANATAAGAVSAVTLTGSLSGTDTQAFEFTLGPVPAGVDELNFTAVQRCADGDTIRWIQPTPPGGEEPQFPAPVLVITRDANSGTAVVATPDSSPLTSVPRAVTTTTTEPPASEDSSSAAVILGIVAAVVVLGAGGFFLAKRRK